MKELNINWLTELRTQARLAFQHAGLPTRQAEDWRYSNVSLFAKKYQPRTTAPSPTLTLSDLESYLLPDTWRVVLVDGQFSAELSSLTQLPDSVTVSSMQQALLTHSALLENYLNHAVPQADSPNTHGFIQFNTAWFSDGAFIHIAAKQVLPEPVQILHIVTQDDYLATTRSLIVLENQAQGQVIETFVGVTPAYLTNAITEVFVGESAQLNLTKMHTETVQANHFSGTYVKQARYGHFTHHAMLLGGLWTRHELHTDLHHAATCELNGLTCGVQRQHIDQHTRINHLEPHALSRQLYKCVLADKARGIFQGRVIVAEGAAKTSSQMNNRNLLLSTEAEVDTKPQLEIYNDDVQCAHGVTVGQLDEPSIFYLQARGIDEATAKNMLTFAFANEMLNKIEHTALHDSLLSALLTRFPQHAVAREWL